MTTKDIAPLYENYHRKISRVRLGFKRYLYDKINWNARIICIRGERGVGKTTMMLQYILEHYNDIDDTLYASLDDLWFADRTLIELVDWAGRHDINRLFLDEVHRYPKWSETLKNIYDNYPDMSIVYTGSSLLILDHAKTDLSRRQTPYTLYGLSLREFLSFNGIFNHAAIPLDTLLKEHVKISMLISAKIKPLRYYEQYLKNGYYPFFNENPEDFFIRLRETANVVIESDLPAIESMSYETIQKIRKLLMIICRNVPFEPKMTELWKQISTNNGLGLRMLYALARAGILSLLSGHLKSYKQLHKPDKIFLGNTNLMYALCENIDKGNERETFFLSQIRMGHEVSYPVKGDFRVNDKYLFEVGGKRKTFDQIADIPDSFLAVDDTETGFGNRIPLWLFGFLY